MDIKKLQKFAIENIVGSRLFDRIMSDNLTLEDVNFLEKAISAKALIEINMKSDAMLSELQNLGMELNGMKNGDNEYAIRLVDWFIENLRFIRDKSADVGLSEIEIK